MPSLHAASAALVGMFFWRAAPWVVRVVLIIYPLLMAVTLVYTGEHYGIDVLVGWLAAGLAITGCAALRRIAPKPLVRTEISHGDDPRSDRRNRDASEPAMG